MEPVDLYDSATYEHEIPHEFGASLARAEISVMFEALLKRMPDIEICEPVRRLRSSGVNSIKSMPVQLTPGG